MELGTSSFKHKMEPLLLTQDIGAFCSGPVSLRSVLVYELEASSQSFARPSCKSLAGDGFHKSIPKGKQKRQR